MADVDSSNPDNCVLMVAEKPSVALAIADVLSQGRKRSRGMRPLLVHDCFAYFAPARRRCSITVTSVVGHVYGLDFEPGSAGRDITSVYSQKTRKIVEEVSSNLDVVGHLHRAAMGCGWLCLWLDCDREGENICYEVMSVLKQYDEPHIWRARFSAVTEREVRTAMSSLGKPNMAEAAAVDVRQVLDLKVGVSFSRLLTRALRDAARTRFSLPALRLISYGPCQTPTLFFTVERQRVIDAFVPRQYWTLAASAMVAGYEVKLAWKIPSAGRVSRRGGGKGGGSKGGGGKGGGVRGDVGKGGGQGSGDSNTAESDADRSRTFDEGLARRAMAACSAALRAGESLTIASLRAEPRAIGAPAGMNTVALLKLTSSALGIGPHRAMQIAEELYTSGYLSYPRTESTRYPQSMDLVPLLQELTHHPTFGKFASWLLMVRPVQIPRKGVDKGDHP